MRFLSFKVGGRTSWGTLDGNRIVDLGARGSAAGLLEYVASGAAAPQGGAADYALADVELTVPLNGGRVFCIGLNYRDHVAETGRQISQWPSIFTRTSQSLAAPGASLSRPAASDNFDFEGELACVIGKGGRHIVATKALEHVFGYCIFNDGSIRDYQNSSVTAGKNFDATGAVGPWIVDKSESPAWDAMTLKTRLNGQIVQHANTDTMIFGVPFVIEYLSKITTLLPGDVIATGTPAGVGMRREPPLWMKPGDVIEVEISGLGVLSNPIVAERV